MKKHIQTIKERLERIGIIKLLIVLIIAFAIFQAGIFVGYYKAGFYGALGNNYYKPFNERRGGNDFGRAGNFGNMMGNMMQNRDGIPGGHGAVGKIVSINLPNIVVASPDNIEKTVTISNDTLIRQFRNTISVTDLKVGENVIILGSPSDSNGGIINARLIRLIPEPPADSAAGTPKTSSGSQNNSAVTSSTSASSSTIK